MATVPQYRGPQIRQSSLSPTFQRGASDPDAFGASRGAGLQRLGRAAQTLGNEVDAAFERKFTREALDAETVLRKEWGLAKSEMAMRQGANAEGVAKESQAWWDKAVADRTKGLDGRALEILNSSISRLRDGEIVGMVNFENQQQRVAFEQSIAANNLQTIDDAVRDPTSERIVAARSTLAANVAALAADKGWAPGSAEARQYALKQSNTLHSQVLNGMLSNPAMPPEAMESYVNTYTAEMDPQTRDGFKAKVTERKVDVVGQRNASEWASLPYSEQITKAGEIKDPAEREATRKWIKSTQEDVRIARAEREKESSDAVWQLVAQGVPQGRLPREKLDAMDGKERVAVVAHYEAQRKARLAEAEGKPVKTDWAVYDEISRLSPADFGKLRLSTLADRISSTDLRSLIDRQRDVRDPAKAPQVATTDQQLGTYLSQLGYKGTDKKAGAFKAQAYDEFQRFAKNNKREPTFEERQIVLDRLATRGDMGFFSSAKPYAQVPPAQRREFVERTVPEADRKEIEKVLTERGKPVTPDNILDLYNRANRAPQ